MEDTRSIADAMVEKKILEEQSLSQGEYIVHALWRLLAALMEVIFNVVVDGPYQEPLLRVIAISTNLFRETVQG